MRAPLNTLHVAVLMGGLSSEREVSLSSGRGCADALEGQVAKVTRVDAGREEWLDAVVGRIAHELGWSDAEAPALPPIDVAATAFQWRVWQALTRIPEGSTCSSKAASAS